MALLHQNVQTMQPGEDERVSSVCTEVIQQDETEHCVH